MKNCLSRGNFDDKIRMMSSRGMQFSLYERFHKRIKLQKRVIGRKNFTYRLIIDVLETYSVNPQKVLDIGCGVGTLSFYTASKGNYVMGIDISPRAIEACKLTAQKLNLDKNTDFLVKDFSEEMIDGRFDLVICSEVLEHLKDDKLVIKKIFNILKESGRILISVPSKNSPLFRLSFVEGFDRRVGHLRRYDSPGVVDLVRGVGFKILEIKKTEGVLRNFLFVSRFGNPFVRLANRFTFVSDLLTFLDNITLKLFGESQIIVVAQKPANKNK